MGPDWPQEWRSFLDPLVAPSWAPVASHLDFCAPPWGPWAPSWALVRSVGRLALISLSPGTLFGRELADVLLRFSEVSENTPCRSHWLWDSIFGPLWPSCWPPWAPFWRPWGSHLNPWGSLLDPLGSLWGPCGVPFGPLGASLGPLGSLLGAWLSCWPPWAPFWPPWGSHLHPWGSLLDPLGSLWGPCGVPFELLGASGLPPARLRLLWHSIWASGGLLWPLGLPPGLLTRPL